MFWRLSHWQTSVTTETTGLSHWRSFRFSECHKAHYNDHLELNILIHNLLQTERLSCQFNFFSLSFFPFYSYNSSWYWTQPKVIYIFFYDIKPWKKKMFAMSSRQMENIIPRGCSSETGSCQSGVHFRINFLAQFEFDGNFVLLLSKSLQTYYKRPALLPCNGQNLWWSDGQKSVFHSSLVVI